MTRTLLERADERKVQLYGPRVHPYNDDVIEAWEHVERAIANYERCKEFRETEFARCPHVDQHGRVYPNHVRTAAFYVGDDRYAVHVSPQKTDQGHLPAAPSTCVFNVSQRLYHGTLTEAFRDTQHTKEGIYNSLRAQLVSDLHTREGAAALYRSFMSAAGSKMFAAQMMQSYLDVAEWVLGEYHPHLKDMRLGTVRRSSVQHVM